jgi:hypothetical protein
MCAAESDQELAIALLPAWMDGPSMDEWTCTKKWSCVLFGHVRLVGYILYIANYIDGCKLAGYPSNLADGCKMRICPLMLLIKHLGIF